MVEAGRKEARGEEKGWREGKGKRRIGEGSGEKKKAAKDSGSITEAVFF